MQVFDKTFNVILNKKRAELEKQLSSDVIFYYGPIDVSYQKVFRDFIEKLKDGTTSRNRLTIVLNTGGGSSEMVEKMVEIIRFHYQEVYFIVPDFAMSAGTILCMSGEKIFMDYTSSLGPIDPQINNGKAWVPALGYLDKFNELVEKARNKTLTDAEFLLMQNQDLATLRHYEQARDLAIFLLKDWLVKYKFKDWTTHQSTPSKIGQAVTPQEKQERADEIARILGDNKIWHSHGRFIGVATLKDVLKLKIEDYSQDKKLKSLIRSYNDLIVEFILTKNYSYFLHSKNYF